MNQNNEQPVNLISVSGRIGSGKDTVGAIIRSLTSGIDPIKVEEVFDKHLKTGILPVYMQDYSSWQIKKFAAKLKQIASILTGIPVEKFEDQEFKAQEMGPEWEKWTVFWSHGDTGPGSASFFTEAELKAYVEQNFEDSYDDVYYGGRIVKSLMTYREFLQKLGTEGIRNTIHPNSWVNALFADYQPIGGVIDTRDYSTYPNWIITDTRFPNEAQAIKDRGGVMIKVERKLYATKCLSCDQAYNLYKETDNCPLCGSKDHNEMHPVVYLDQHDSETALNDYPFDYIIVNDGSIEELIEKVRTILYHLKVI